ncbi:hypothetical protein AV929_15675 [Haloarcula sp. K1]|nr:hypothetical protein AV929_15675 [Haloarcula sp. K1]
MRGVRFIEHQPGFSIAMSATASQPRLLEQSSQQPVADRLNAANNWNGESLDSVAVFKEYTTTNEGECGTRPHVLNHQVPISIGEAILTTLPLSPLYQYHRKTEQVTAWRVGETSKALIRLDTQTRTLYLLPALGETQLDAFWMLAFSLRFRHPFTLTYLTVSTVESVLSIIPPSWREGAEELLYNHFDRDTPRMTFN